jgi:hypothetical protein
MRCLRGALLAMAACSICGAAEEIGAVPVLSGYLYDAQARALRAVLGVPGSAYVSEPVVDELDAAWPSPDRNHAIAVRREKTLVLTSLKTLHPGEAAHVHAAIRPTRVSWSARGQAAVLYSANESSLQIIRFAGSSVTAEAAISLRSVAGDLSALAITDSGNVSFSAGDAVYIVSESGPAQRWMLAGTTSLAFCRGDRLYATAAGVLVELGTGGEVRREPAADAPAAGVTCTNARLITADPRKPAIVVYESDGTSVEISLDRPPSAVDPIQAGSVLLLNGPEDGRRPAIVLDVSGSPGVFFVPLGDAGAL